MMSAPAASAAWATAAFVVSIEISPSVSALDLHVDLGTNVLNSGAVVNFDVLLNGIDVGDIVFTQASGTGAFDYSFGFASIASGGTYTITFDETNTVPDGQGSISFDLVRPCEQHRDPD